MYESELDSEDDRPNVPPRYEEMFGWANDPQDVDDPERPRRLGYIGLTLIFIVIIATGLILLSHQQYDAGYVNGERDVAVPSYSAGEQVGMGIGYQDGEKQGKLEALVGLQEWEYSHKCAVDKDGFVMLKVYRNTENQYQYECVVSKK